MIKKTPLDQLAEAHDIEPGYTDIWQQRHLIGEETKRALLAAMGVPAASDAEIGASLEAAKAKAFDRLAPEVVVWREAEPIVMPIIVDGGEGGRLSWSIVTENGEAYSGEAVIDDLEIINQSRTRGGHWIRHALPLSADLLPGYHRFRVTVNDARSSETEIIVTPASAYWPSSLDRQGGLSGVMAPLYGLRSARNGGIGDFADLADLASTTAAWGAAFVGINPVHALFPSIPDRISPYAPSSRSFLNILMIALDKVPELAQSSGAKAMLARSDIVTLQKRLSTKVLVDYPGVTRLKLPPLEELFKTFLTLPENSERRQCFDCFVLAGGEQLLRQARFDALLEHFTAGDRTLIDWHDWPAAYRTPDSRAVRDFAGKHSDRVTFYLYVQWLADDQLATARQCAVDAGMALGLYLDLAVGVAPDGAEAWSHQDVLAGAVRLGTPPDDFNPNGQNWGLLPFAPAALRAQRYRPFIDLLERSMRHAGMLRIDHVLGLARSYWLPADRDVQGAYISYPMRDLLGLVALESKRRRCVVVGEDLGTVPKRLRAALGEHDLLGCRLLYFERDKQGGFRAASAYPKACITSIGTHDLPTLNGFWQARDIDQRERLGFFPKAGRSEEERRERQVVRRALLRLLAEERLLPAGLDPEDPTTPLTWPLVEAFHRFLARTPAVLKAVQLEDAVLAIDQANLPGTVSEYPNWRRKIDLPLERLDEASGLRSLLELFDQRPMPPGTQA